MFDKGIGGLFKQAQEMQSKLGAVQDELRNQRVEASTGGGMVKVVANGLNEVLSVHVDDQLINLQDRAVLEDLITAAMNEVQRKVKDLAKEEMTKVTGGFKIPGLFP